MPSARQSTTPFALTQTMDAPNHGTCERAVDNEHWDVVRWLRAEADPPCPWTAETEDNAMAELGEAEVASWGGPPDVGGGVFGLVPGVPPQELFQFVLGDHVLL